MDVFILSGMEAPKSRYCWRLKLDGDICVGRRCKASNAGPIILPEYEHFQIVREILGKEGIHIPLLTRNSRPTTFVESHD